MTVKVIAVLAQIVFYFGYLPILLAIAFREYYDKSTTKAFIISVAKQEAIANQGDMGIKYGKK